MVIDGTTKILFQINEYSLQYNKTYTLGRSFWKLQGGVLESSKTRNRIAN